MERCYCHKFHDSGHLDKLASMLDKCVEDALDEGHKRIDSALGKSKILSDPTIAN